MSFAVVGGEVQKCQLPPFLDAIASVGLHMSVCHTFLSVMEFLVVTILHNEHDDQSEDIMTNLRT